MPESISKQNINNLPAIATLDVVGFFENREIASVKEPGSDLVKYLAPVSGTSRSYLDVRTSRGQIFRIPIEESILDAICGHIGLESNQEDTLQLVREQYPEHAQDIQVSSSTSPEEVRFNITLRGLLEHTLDQVILAFNKN